MRQFLFAIMCFLHLVSLAAKPIVIKTQEQFDYAVERINHGEEMHLRLANDTFVLKKSIKSQKPFSMSASNATILCSTGKFEIKDKFKGENGFNVYRIANNITHFALFYDEAGNLIPVSESVNEEIKVNYAEGGIIADKNMKAGTTVKIPIPAHLKHLRDKQFSKAFGYFDCGWQTVNFILERSDNTYFYCKTLNLCRTGNYSYDKQANKDYVRYVIYNAEKKQNSIYYDGEFLYVPSSISNLYYLGCCNYEGTEPDIVFQSDVTVKGVCFIGASVEVNTDAAAKCEFFKCSFFNTLGSALRITRTGELAVRKATVKNCLFKQVSLLTDYVISFISPNDGGCYAALTSCEIVRYPDDAVGYKNPDGCVGVKGNVTLKNNMVWNTPRCHLYFNYGNITASGNVLFNTDGFNSMAERNLSSDLGLIYCNHVYRNADKAIANKTSFVLLKNNLLYGAYAYRGDARGVFIDNGRGDVTCKDNIILNCQLYSMDSRNSMQDAASIRNRYEGNVVTTNYRLAAGSAVMGENTPVTKSNVMVTQQRNTISNVIVEKEDISIGDIDVTTTCKDGVIAVSDDMYKVLKKSPEWKRLRRYVVKNK